MTPPASSTTVGDRTITMTRTFNARPDLVFRTWSECEHLGKWFGPKGFTLSHCDIDFRPGGRWHFCMSHPDFPPAWGIAIYRDIVAPEHIVYTDAFSDEDGNVVPPESQVTVTFEEVGDRTQLTLEMLFATAEDRQKVADMGAVEGWGSTLDSLDDHLATLE